MIRSLADLASFATDPDLDPFERMCPRRSLTNRAHAVTADLARTCAAGEETLGTWAMCWPCQPRT